MTHSINPDAPIARIEYDNTPAAMLGGSGWGASALRPFPERPAVTAEQAIPAGPHPAG